MLIEAKAIIMTCKSLKMRITFISIFNTKKLKIQILNYFSNTSWTKDNLAARLSLTDFQLQNTCDKNLQVLIWYGMIPDDEVINM